ncbi:ABC transporter permease [Amycolatopsis antarctica]|uniref:ABC transporter permease n=1 Tax=Amycolatopsis antarctica TaxID=1854586 RepID=A0A263D8L7_9PSEU|nr:ABC transporter permease [Amycolatopsis antarctica]OZM73735.1 ABC transporter permease [Amycolatopsis antarctica]
MGNLIKAELRKTLTTKSWWGLLIPAVVFSFGFAFGWGNVVNEFGDYLGSSDARTLTSILGLDPDALPVGLLAMAHGINIGTIFPMIFGVFALAGEYGKKTISTTFLTAPNRGAALTAKMVTYIGWGVLYGVVNVLFASLGTVLTVDGARMPDTGQFIGVLGAGVLATTLATLFGIGVGAMWRSVTGSVITLMIYMLIVENILIIVAYASLDLDWLGGVLPNGAANGIVGAIGAEAFGAAGVTLPGLDAQLQWSLQFAAGAPGAFSWWASALIFGGWTLAFFGTGWFVNQRRDIT